MFCTAKLIAGPCPADNNRMYCTFYNCKECGKYIIPDEDNNSHFINNMTDEFKQFCASKLQESKNTRQPHTCDLDILILEWDFDNNRKKSRKKSLMHFTATVAIQQEDSWFVAKCLENSVVSQGETIDEAMENLKEALELYFEDYDEVPPTNKLFVTTLEVAI